MKSSGLFVLVVVAMCVLIFGARNLVDDIALVAYGALAIGVLIVFVAVFSKAYRNWKV